MIPILIPIPMVYDSDSNSDSKDSQIFWFRFHVSDFDSNFDYTVVLTIPTSIQWRFGNITGYSPCFHASNLGAIDLWEHSWFEFGTYLVSIEECAMGNRVDLDLSPLCIMGLVRIGWFALSIWLEVGFLVSLLHKPPFWEKSLLWEILICLVYCINYHQNAMPAVFSDEEVVIFLAFVRETNTFKAIDGRVQRNIEVFNRLTKLTNDRHHQDNDKNKKTGEQRRTKWKSLKKRFLDEKIKENQSGLWSSICVSNRPIFNNLSVIEFQFSYICHLCFSQVMMMMRMETKFEDHRLFFLTFLSLLSLSQQLKIPLSEGGVFHR